MACECDGFARQSSKLLDKVRFLGELLMVAGRLRSAVCDWLRHSGVCLLLWWCGALIGIATELKLQCLWVRLPLAPLIVVFRSAKDT